MVGVMACRPYLTVCSCCCSWACHLFFVLWCSGCLHAGVPVGLPAEYLHAAVLFRPCVVVVVVSRMSGRVLFVTTLPTCSTVAMAVDARLNIRFDITVHYVHFCMLAVHLQAGGRAFSFAGACVEVTCVGGRLLLFVQYTCRQAHLPCRGDTARHVRRLRASSSSTPFHPS